MGHGTLEKLCELCGKSPASALLKGEGLRKIRVCQVCGLAVIKATVQL